MKKCFTILIIFCTINLFAQSIQDILCKSDTFDLSLAYGFEGEFVPYDVGIRNPPFTIYKNSPITINDYQNGIFGNWSEFGTPWEKLNSCGINLVTDSTILKMNLRIFDTLPTKIITQTNTTFGGMTGKVLKQGLEFKFKIFRVKLIAVYLGLFTKNLVNIDRISKNDNEIIEVNNIPYYFITRILDVQPIN